MKVTRTKNGIAILLKQFPSITELEELNKYGTFTLCTKRGYTRLLQHIPSSTTPSVPCIMECPIGQTFTI